jgi:hypothetical protein
MGSESNLKALDMYVNTVNDIIPVGIADPTNQYLNEPFNYETYGNIVEEVAKFGITAVPAAKIVGMMSSANAIVRGFAWGGIADYMSMNPEDPAIATFLVDYFETDREKLEPWARNAISVLEKHDTDGVITKRLKNMMEGTIAGGLAEGILPLVKGIIKATSIVPWAKTVTPLVGGAGVTFSEDAEGSVFSSIVKGAAKEVLPNTIAKNVDNVMQVDDLGFYSKGLEEAKLLKQEKGTGQQFKAMLLKSGVKQEEIEWSGLDEILNKEKVTKKEIIDQLEANKIELEEIEKAGSQEENFMDFGFSEDGVSQDNNFIATLIANKETPEDSITNIQRLRSTMSGDDAFGADYFSNRADEIYNDFDTDLVDKKGYSRDDAYDIAINEYYENPVRIYEDSNTGYVITGNDELGYSIFRSRGESSNFKNALNTSTERRENDIPYSLDEAKVQAQNIAEEQGDLIFEGSAGKYEDYTVDGGDNYRELLLTFGRQGVVKNNKMKNTSKYFSGHFDEENILAHIRVKDRNYGDKKVLYVEEIQSDWGQDARKKGFLPDGKEKIEIEDNLKKGILELQEKYNEYTILKDGKQIPFRSWYKGFNLNSPQTISQIKLMNESFMDQTQDGYIYKNGKNIKGKDNIYVTFGNFSEMVSELQSQSNKLDAGVPKVPFVTDTNKWTALAMKRILAKASQEGYDAVAITPGKVHVNRWNTEGLGNYYDNIVPKVAKQVVGKLGGIVKKLPSSKDIDLRDTPSGNSFKNVEAFDEALFIELTPQVKKKTFDGQSMFAIPLAVGVAAYQQDSNT